MPVHIQVPFENYGHEIKVGSVTMVVCFSLTLFSYMNNGGLDLVGVLILPKNWKERESMVHEGA